MPTISEVHSIEFPHLFAEFESIVGAKTWLDKCHDISQEIRGKRFLKDYLLHENRVVYILTELSRERNSRGQIQQPVIQSPEMYEACTFVAQFVYVHSVTKTALRHKIAQRIRSALGNPRDLRAIQFEYLIAAHLAKRGFSVEFIEPNEKPSADILATKDGVITEIECKSVSKNRGSKIYERDALELFNLLREESRAYATQLKAGLILRVIIPDRAPSTYAAQKELCKKIIRALFSAKSLISDDLEVHIHEFNVQESPFKTERITKHELRAFLENQFSIRNTWAFITCRPPHRALIFSLESKAQNSMLDNLFEVIADSCSRQLSQKYPGIVCVKFEDISAVELKNIGIEEGKPTELRIRTSNFLNDHRNSPLVYLGFFADGPVLHRDGGVISSSGINYFFQNEDSPFYNPTSLSVFSGLDQGQ